MIIRARPSKTFFYQHFAEDMQLSREKRWGADIACAQFKHYGLFQTEKYLGVDLQPEVFAGSLEKRKQGNVFSLVSDVRQMAIKEQSLDFLVSTHTFSHLSVDDRLPVLRAFVRLLEHDGDLIFNIPYTNRELETEVDQVLTAAFTSIKKIRYRNLISNWYETTLSTKEGRLTFEGRNFVARRVLAAMSLFISLLEHIPILQTTGDMLYYCARGKLR